MPDLRYLKIPKSVAVVVDGEHWSFVRCFTYIGDTHPAFASGAGLKDYVRVLAKLESAQEDDVVTLDEADMRLVQTALMSPPNGYIPELTPNGVANGKPFRLPPRTFITYVNAVSDDATKNPPEAKEINGVAAKVLPAPAPQAL